MFARGDDFDFFTVKLDYRLNCCVATSGPYNLKSILDDDITRYLRWNLPGLRTLSIFNRVQEIFASPNSSSNSKNFIFRVQVQVWQK